MRGYCIILAIALSSIVGMSWVQVEQAQGQTGTCATLVAQALSDLGTNCAGLGPDSACYGFSKVTAVLFGQSRLLSDSFSEPGDQINLAQVRSISTGGFSEADSEWGIAVMNVRLGAAQASTMSNTVFLAMGDVAITNRVDPSAALAGLLPVLAPMQEFTLITGKDSEVCSLVPPSALIVQSPAEAPVTIRVNNVDIQIGSTVMLRASSPDRLQVITGNGSAILFPNAANRVEVPAGAALDVVIGPSMIEWQNWRVMTQVEWDRFAAIEDVPLNVLPNGYWNPAIVQASGVGGPRPQVQLPWGITRPRPRIGQPFPLIAMHTGPLGQSLPGGAWAPLTIGPAAFSNLVLYHSNRANNWDIFGLDLAAGTSTNITQSPTSAEIEPSFSPDGAWVAFVSDRDPQGNWEIYISKTDGSAVQRLTYNSGMDIHPAWGPGGLIVFSSNRDGVWKLYVVDVAGDGVPKRLAGLAKAGTAQRLAKDETNDLGAAWFSDGEHIVFESDRDGDWDLYRLNVVSGALEQLTENDTVDRQAVVSHDGKRLAWLQTDEAGVENIWLMDLATGKSAQVTASGYSAGGVVFSPDDTVIVFHMSDTDGDSEIFAYEPATAALKALTSNTVDDRAPTFFGGTPLVIYQSLVDDAPDVVGQYELFIVNPLPIAGPADIPVRLMVQQDADDLFALNDPRTGSSTRSAGLLDDSAE